MKLAFVAIAISGGIFVKNMCDETPKKAQEKPNQISRKASKRLLSNASVGQLLDDDLRRESKRAKQLVECDIITFECNAPLRGALLNPNMIPKSLRDRFPAAIGVVGDH